MKTKTILTHAYITIVIILGSYYAQAQQPINNAGAVSAGKTSAYTYKIFQAPNKMFGYDIFCNDKIIFHQVAPIVQPRNSIAVLAKKEQADKAALLAIEKIKMNQPATLTQEEIKKIITK